MRGMCLQYHQRPFESAQYFYNTNELISKNISVEMKLYGHSNTMIHCDATELESISFCFVPAFFAASSPLLIPICPLLSCLLAYSEVHLTSRIPTGPSVFPVQSFGLLFAEILSNQSLAVMLFSVTFLLSCSVPDNLSSFIAQPHPQWEEEKSLS